MPWRLKSHDLCPPGSFRFEQTTGIQHKFPSTPLINHLANQVSDFRKANKLERANYVDALEDIDAYNCTRLGNMKEWCYSTERNFREIVKLPGSGCGGCGMKVA